MACKVCGEFCHCAELNREVSRQFADPDPYDRSEEQFASSLGGAGEVPSDEQAIELIASSTLAETLQRHPGLIDMNQHSSPGSKIFDGDDERSESWKQELTSRLHKYKAKRRERLGQSSLDFSFESTTANHVFMKPEYAEEQLSTSQQDFSSQQFLTPTHFGSTAPELEARARPLDTSDLFSQPTQIVEEEPAPTPEVGKLIEFPRTQYLAPAINPYELAEPVLDSPRILDVPETVAAPPPPLSDIELEPATEELDPKLLEPVLDVAPLPQRMFSGIVDAILVLGATALFGTIVLKISGPALLADQRTVLLVAGAVPAALWAIYNYLFLVYGARTLGMMLARLHLVTFDGQPVRRATRKMRVFSLQLSCLSVGLGLIWAFIDDDQICWHDRITHTYLSAR